MTKHIRLPFDNAPSQIAGSIRPDGVIELVRIPYFDARKHPRLTKVFGDLRDIRNFDPDRDHELVCPDCARHGVNVHMHHVGEKHDRKNGAVVASECFQSVSIAAHLDGCMFKKPGGPSTADAVRHGISIVLNLQGELGHEGPARKSSWGGKLRTPYQRWSQYMHKNGWVAQRSAATLDDLLAYIKRVEDLGAEKARQPGQNEDEGREDALSLIALHHKGEIANLLPEKDPLPSMLRGMIETAVYVKDSTYVFDAPRLRRVNLSTSTRYDHNTHSLLVAAEDVHEPNAHYRVRHHLYFRELDDDNISEKTTRAKLAQILDHTGSHIDVLATPRMDPDMAKDALRAINHMSSTNLPMVDLYWVIADAGAQMRAAKPVTTQAKPVSNFVSGITPLKPGERRITPTLRDSLQTFAGRQLTLF